jgi:hypothetical protein
MVETYVRVLYDAVREVDDALSAIRLMGSRQERQQAATDAARRAWDFSQESYMAGAVDYLVVLDTERTYHRNLDDWYNVRMERYRGLINLFSALGGGVAPGSVLPGEGARPGTLTAEIDYGVVLSASLPKSGEVREGAPPPAPERQPDIVLTASLPARVVPDRVDWTDRLLHEDKEQWLVEMAGVYERGAVFAAWRDLRSRFPDLTASRSLLPRQQGRVGGEGEGGERVSWYRLYLAGYSDRQAADAACTALHAGQQRCRVVSSHASALKGDSCSASGHDCNLDVLHPGTATKDDFSATLTRPQAPADKEHTAQSGDGGRE